METPSVKQKEEVNIRFRDLKLIGFELSNVGQELKEQPDVDRYEFDFELTPHVGYKDKFIGFNVKITIKLKEADGGRTILGDIRTFASFSIQDFDTIVKPLKDNVFDIPEIVIQTLAGLTVSSTRGMFAISSSTSKISNAIIPVISPKEFFKMPVLKTTK